MDRTVFTDLLVDKNVEFCAGVPDRDNDGITDGGKDSCQVTFIF